jgi:hypothetical protein
MRFSLEVTKGLIMFNSNFTDEKRDFLGQMNTYFVVIGLISRQNGSLNMFAHCSDV